MASAVRVVISGAGGRMGTSLATLAPEEEGLEVVGGVGRKAATFESGGATLPVVPVAEAAGMIEGADVVIDFSAPAFLRQLLEAHGGSMDGRALVVGTTGLGKAEERLLDARAEVAPVVTAANFGIGVNVMLSLVRQAAVALPGFDVEIVEAHHRRKEDAPSGTAMALGEAVAAGLGADLERVRRDGRSGRPGRRPSGEIGFHAVRGGGVVGDHQVHFLGDLERIEITHRASDRSLFAAGALRAARWAAGREPGRYSMRHVLGFA